MGTRRAITHQRGIWKRGDGVHPVGKPRSEPAGERAWEVRQPAATTLHQGQPTQGTGVSKAIAIAAELCRAAPSKFADNRNKQLSSDF
ncbi:unnamed protein product [Urochloa humidicola]